MGKTLGEMIGSLPKRRRGRVDKRYRELKEDVESLSHEVLGEERKRFSSQDIHSAIFPKKRKPKPTAHIKEGIRKYIRRCHASG